MLRGEGAQERFAEFVVALGRERERAEAAGVGFALRGDSQRRFDGSEEPGQRGGAAMAAVSLAVDRFSGLSGTPVLFLASVPALAVYAVIIWPAVARMRGRRGPLHRRPKWWTARPRRTDPHPPSTWDAPQGEPQW